MKVISSPRVMQKLSEAWRKNGSTIALVPTMGALHEGHLSLIHLARKKSRYVVVSIYVNPSQFGPKEDLGKYPRPRDKDLALCRAAGVTAVFAPINLYAGDHSTWIEETVQALGQEGTMRPGHFRGVATVVLKLLNLVQPTHAYFGQKDAQQVAVIKRMVRDLDVPVKIIVGAIIRDQEGLALSSRNIYLSAEERKLAVEFARLLKEAAQKSRSGQAWFQKQLSAYPGIILDYIERVPEGKSERLIAAVKIGSTRLLDNQKVSAR